MLSCSFALTCLVLSHILVCAFLSLSHGFVPVGGPILSRCFALVFLRFVLLLFAMFCHGFALILMCFLMRHRVPLLFHGIAIVLLTFSWYGHGFPVCSYASALV